LSSLMQVRKSGLFIQPRAEYTFPKRGSLMGRGGWEEDCIGRMREGGCFMSVIIVRKRSWRNGIYVNSVQKTFNFESFFSALCLSTRIDQGWIGPSLIPSKQSSRYVVSTLNIHHGIITPISQSLFSNHSSSSPL